MKLSSLNSSTPSRVLTVNPSFFPEKLPWPDLGTAVWLQPQPSSLLPLSTNRANIALLACFDCFSNLKLDVLRWPLCFLSPWPPVSAQICSGLSLSLPLVLCPNATWDQHGLNVPLSSTKLYMSFFLTRDPWPPFSFSIYFRKLAVFNSQSHLRCISSYLLPVLQPRNVFLEDLGTIPLIWNHHGR